MYGIAIVFKIFADYSLDFVLVGKVCLKLVGTLIFIAVGTLVLPGESLSEMIVLR